MPARQQLSAFSTTAQLHAKKAAAAAKPLPYKPRLPRNSAQPPKPHPRFRISSRVYYSGTAIFALVIGTYTASLYKSYNAAIAESATLNISEADDLIARYDEQADGWDREVNTMEAFLGVNRLRRRLVERARGEVLEVSTGTGRNAVYYAKVLDGIKSVTWVDRSSGMMKGGRKVWEELYPSFEPVTFLTQDASAPLPEASIPCNGYDTIFQTFGLCSMRDPVGLLHNLEKICNKDDGQILLLEHGRSHYGFANKIIDNLAKIHAYRWGCWWNRDIGRIVEESGLEVVKMERFHLGTTWLIELRPRKVGESGKGEEPQGS